MNVYEILRLRCAALRMTCGGGRCDWDELWATGDGCRHGRGYGMGVGGLLGEVADVQGGEG